MKYYMHLPPYPYAKTAYTPLREVSLSLINLTARTIHQHKSRSSLNLQVKVQDYPVRRALKLTLV